MSQKKNIMLILTLILSAVILTSIASSTGDDAKVAIIVPHPDDETIGMAGIIQMLMAHGSEVHCELMTSGNAVTPKLLNVTNYYNISIPENATVSERKGLIREDAFKRVMAIYGVTDYTIDGYNDGYLNADTVFSVMQNLYLEDGYTEFYTVTGDGNVDHHACYEAMIMMENKYPNLKYREVPIYWYHADRATPTPILNVFHDINVKRYSYKTEEAFQVYYNINSILPAFYPYSDGLYRTSHERVYYANLNSALLEELTCYIGSLKL